MSPGRDGLGAIVLDEEAIRAEVARLGTQISADYAGRPLHLVGVLIEGKDVLVVEGICASGLSLAYLLRNFQTRHPASLKVCSFLLKRRDRPAQVAVDYVGREIPDRFVVGYGLDADERFRNLPHVVELTPSA
jgi:hypoxanthine phosphoribosyltransferase